MGLKSLVYSIVSHVTYLNLRCFIKKLSFLESFAYFTFSETHNHVHQHSSAPRHLLPPRPSLPTSRPPTRLILILIMPDFAPPPVGVAQLRPHSYDEPAPATEQDVVMDRRVLSTWLSSTSSRLAPESAGSTKVPTCLVTLSSLYGTSTTSQCTSIC